MTEQRSLAKLTPDQEKRFFELCRNRQTRAAMTDEEFWAHVLRSDSESARNDLDFSDAIDDVELVSLDASPCDTCGSKKECGYDEQGRPMIHTTKKGSDDGRGESEQ